MGVVRRFACPVLVAPLFVSAACPVIASQATRSEQTITVVGEVPEALQREVRDYVHKLGVVPGNRPAARWVQQVCPAAFGLAPAHASLVTDRIRTIAASVRAPIAKAGCKPNLVIAFTDNAAAMVQQISHSDALGSVTYDERRRLETDSTPIRWWYNSTLRGEDGTLPADLPMLGANMEGFTAYSRPSGPGSRGNLNLRGATLVGTQTMRTIEHAAVVVDVNHANGKGLKSVIDYAALVGLSEVRHGAAPSNSILNLFEPGGSRSLTANDTAFLKGLYGLQLSRKAEEHRRVLVGSIVKSRMELRSGAKE